MAVTINIPQITLSAQGVRNLGPRSLSGLASATFSIDRTAGASNLNSLPQDQDAIQIVFQFSKNGGTTWPDTSSETIAGGVFLTKQGATKTTEAFTLGIDADVNSVQAQVTALETVSLAGTITVT